ncbi:MAG: hypothetical protein ABI835_17035, partial [Chloroflexota bacterium]
KPVVRLNYRFIGTPQPDVQKTVITNFITGNAQSERFGFSRLCTGDGSEELNRQTQPITLISAKCCAIVGEGERQGRSGSSPESAGKEQMCDLTDAKKRRY